MQRIQRNNATQPEEEVAAQVLAVLVPGAVAVDRVNRRLCYHCETCRFLLIPSSPFTIPANVVLVQVDVALETRRA